MHTNLILANKRCTQAQYNSTNTKPKAWFRHLVRHPARKRSEPILQPWTHTVAAEYCVSVTHLIHYGLQHNI